MAWSAEECAQDRVPDFCAMPMPRPASRLSPHPNEPKRAAPSAMKDLHSKRHWDVHETLKPDKQSFVTMRRRRPVSRGDARRMIEHFPSDF